MSACDSFNVDCAVTLKRVYVRIVNPASHLTTHR
ncbi:hypothetical protein C8E97_2140 [Saccharothrix australiensis]|uniref:Uncharacterized protein n=1 Tax=Saccharothrix australiensis TaxID=2072 RepID=A0A495VW08_9PSEU|nr:hypothetical protein C8E97_2140 [Saccharothrix australiensis]